MAAETYIKERNRSSISNPGNVVLQEDTSKEQLNKINNIILRGSVNVSNCVF